jgi:signal transduction histidine kinase
MVRSLLSNEWGINSVSEPRRKSILRYWSIRYFVVLFICLAIMGSLTAYIIQLDIQNDQYRSMMQMTSDMAAMAEARGMKLPKGPELARWFDNQSIRHGLTERTIMYMLDGKGRIVKQFPPNSPYEARQLASRQQEIMTGEAHIITLEPHLNRPPYLVAVHPIGDHLGYMLLLMPEASLLEGFNQLRIPRFILACTLILTGWGVIYMLTRRLIKPIQKAAEAAKQVVAGNYNVQLDRIHREQEIFELMHAFKEMADRLKWLESLRTQLLAGVTHELKTPVASISGLIQAVKAGVVSGQEAEKFLGICLKECQRLQKMVEDLLDFNSFAGNALTVEIETCDLKATIKEITERWQHGQEKACPQVNVEVAANVTSWETMTDPFRLEQVIINLLNNAKDAMEPGGVLFVRLLSDSARFRIQVKDTGHGILADEQLDIFEPFYRGKKKKTKVRGLGLGLPFSRLIARSLGGDLVLTDSSPAGTVFTLLIPFEGSDTDH